MPNSGSYELCYPERDTTIVGNLVHDNGSSPDTPAIDVAKLAMGTGILPAGGRDNLIQNNRVYNHERVGIGLVPFPEENPKDDIPTGDELTMPCSEARTLPRADKASLPVDAPAGTPMGNTVKGNVVVRLGHRRPRLRHARPPPTRPSATASRATPSPPRPRRTSRR